MEGIDDIISKLEFAQICWVVKDIHAAADFFSKSLGTPTFPAPELVRAQDLGMTYLGEVVAAEWLTTQAYNGLNFVELVQPLSGQSMFHDYLNQYPAGGAQHFAYRLSVSDFEEVVGKFQAKGYEIISEVGHPIARMAFFDTYETIGAVTEIMGITPEGWKAVEQMKNSN
ncbi:VOC family protein [Dyadobacter sp. CY347]|uniref:VOC family protein n=1 Tax=Dyadobacter sp. CY347 TaxID=2909336 RepID=UPI001F275DA9|nr:VOC family protein [Dyadobacter sp. CY347]MCF2488093.1 VOC family protein [Dyadobacter sp. CY347]